MSQSIEELIENKIASHGDLHLVAPECEKGIDSVILSPTVPFRIHNLKVQPVPIWPGDHGYFAEVFRTGHGFPAAYDLKHTQISAALTYPGEIKACHYHLHQTDCWMADPGMLQVALVDLRCVSPTFGARNGMYAGVLRPWQLLIPQGIAQGYKVISLDPSVLVYATDQFYNSKDEGRIVHNNPAIAYDWESQDKIGLWP
jgi:dTDP-4-dehydrorhamnose 3,5-epimerase